MVRGDSKAPRSTRIIIIIIIIISSSSSSSSRSCCSQYKYLPESRLDFESLLIESNFEAILQCVNFLYK